MKKRCSFGVVLALALMLLVGCSTMTTSTERVPRFEPGPCVSKLGAGVQNGVTAECGNLVVREDRSDPNSRLIKLAVVILKTQSRGATAPDPVIYLSGGPGESPLTDFVPLFSTASLDYALGNRDLIVFDPRGVGYSRPSLDCPELRAAEYGVLDQNTTPQQEVVLERTALQQCYSRLTASGIDLNLYNTDASSADVQDLAKARGYTLYSLEGGSYGTRLGLQIMREQAVGVKSVILDAVFAPQVTFFTGIPPALMDSFKALFRTCAADATCNAKYPNLESLLYTLIAQLDAHPLSLAVQDQYTGAQYSAVLNGFRLVALLTLSLYATDLIPRIPFAISSALQGSTSELVRMFDEVWFGEDAISRGMWYSAECREDAPFVTPDGLTSALSALPPPIRGAAPFNMQGRFDNCQVWKVDATPAAEKQAVTSLIPTLILEGEFDPVTPPSNGQLVAATLRNSTFLTFPGIGHGVMYTAQCPLTIALQFVDTTSHLPDTACMQELGEPAYV